MKTKRKFGETQIPCKGKVIIQHLDIARRLLIALPFTKEVQLAAVEEQSRTIEASIVEVATLCSGSEYWHQLHKFLEEAGIEVTQEFCWMKTYLDRVMDESPAEAKRT